MLVERGADALVSWGVAGALDPRLQSGTVMLPETVLATGNRYYESDVGWRNRLESLVENEVTTSAGLLLQTDQIVREPRSKREIHDQTSAAAVDMETGSVAMVAAEAGVPWVAIRAIVDSSLHRLPSAVQSAVDESGNLQRSFLIGAMLSPSDWVAVFRLWRASAAAARSMRRVWSIGKPDLGSAASANS